MSGRPRCHGDGHPIVRDRCAFLLEVHAGLEYRAFGLERGLNEAGAKVETPMEGVPMGKQLRAYKAARG